MILPILLKIGFNFPLHLCVASKPQYGVCVYITCRSVIVNGTAPSINKLIHIAVIEKPKQGSCLLLLRQKEPTFFSWWEQTANGTETETTVSASTTEEALRLARQQWKYNSFRTIICGFRYTLPERDEHGMNALFHQMVASYSSSNGIYFDDELGHNCFVQAASMEARSLWQLLKLQNRI